VITSYDVTDRAVELLWEDGHRSVFHHIWLWDNCSRFRHPDNGQRLTNPADSPDDLHPRSVRLNSGLELEIEWSPDGHTSCYDANWLRVHCYTERRLPASPNETRLWDSAQWPLSPTMTYQDISTDTTALRDWLQAFQMHGVVLLSNVPLRSGMVKDVGQLVSFIVQNGWQNEYYDIRAEEGANVIANTSLALPAHTDDPYFDPPPQVNLVHCLENDADGGESTLVDGFNVAETMRHKFPDQFDLLTRFPIRFRLFTGKNEYEYEAPVIRLKEPDGEIKIIRYSNQSTQPFNIPAEFMDAYYEAYRTFSRLIVDETFEIHFKLRPGDLYMIDNYRLLHGRTALSSMARRHLQACYVARDGLRSRLASLNSRG